MTATASPHEAGQSIARSLRVQALRRLLPGTAAPRWPRCRLPRSARPHFGGSCARPTQYRGYRDRLHSVVDMVPILYARSPNEGHFPARRDHDAAAGEPRMQGHPGRECARIEPRQGRSAGMSIGIGHAIARAPRWQALALRGVRRQASVRTACVGGGAVRGELRDSKRCAPFVLQPVSARGAVEDISRWSDAREFASFQSNVLEIVGHDARPSSMRCTPRAKSVAPRPASRSPVRGKACPFMEPQHSFMVRRTSEQLQVALAHSTMRNETGSAEYHDCRFAPLNEFLTPHAHPHCESISCS